MFAALLARLLLLLFACCRATTPTTPVAEAKLQRRLAKASRRVEAVARGFDALRSAASGAPPEALESASAGLDEPGDLQERFELLRQRSNELSQAPGPELQEGMAEHTDRLEVLAADLEARLELTRESLLAALPDDDVKQRFASAASLEEARSAAAAAVLELTEAARSSSPSALATARRLGARLARAADVDGSSAADLAERLEQIRDLEVETRAALAKLQRPSPEHGGGVSPQAAAADDGCDEAQVAAAAKRFDKAVGSFRGRVLKAMLPPEVENLHRIVHTMEVMKSTLLQELAEGGQGVYGTDASGATKCDQYFAGVGQIERDLGHYKAQAERERSGGRRKGRRRKGGGGQDALPEPAVEGKPRSQISALPAPGRQTGMGRPALDVRGFR